MYDLLPAPVISPLRQRLIEEIGRGQFSHETQRNYLRDVGRLELCQWIVMTCAVIKKLWFQPETHQRSIPQRIGPR